MKFSVAMKIDKNKIIIQITAHIGCTEMPFGDFINICTGSKIKIRGVKENNVCLYANNKLIGNGKFKVFGNKAAVEVHNKF